MASDPCGIPSELAAVELVTAKVPVNNSEHDEKSTDFFLPKFIRAFFWLAASPLVRKQKG